MFCSKCGNEVPKSLAYCPKCGNETFIEKHGGIVQVTKEQGLKRKKRTFIAMIAVFCVLVLSSYIWSQNSETGSDYSQAQVGDHLEFGTYEQDNDLSNGSEPIEWEVVEVEEDSIKVISYYILDVVSESNFQNYTWPNSELRVWLNEDFLNTAFTEEEQGRIKITSVKCEAITEAKDTDRGWDFAGSFGNTEDKIFIPGVEDGGYPASAGHTRVTRCSSYILRNTGIVYEYTDPLFGTVHKYDPFILVPMFRRDGGELSSECAVSWLRNNNESKVGGVRPVMWLKTK